MGKLAAALEKTISQHRPGNGQKALLVGIFPDHGGPRPPAPFPGRGHSTHSSAQEGDWLARTLTVKILGKTWA